MGRPVFIIGTQTHRGFRQMHFSQLPVGTKFKMAESGVLLKLSPKSYTLARWGKPTKGKSSGRLYMPKHDPDPVVEVVTDS